MRGWFRRAPFCVEAERLTAPAEIVTLEGVMSAPAGAWRVYGLAGEEYFISDAIFRQSYQPENATAEALWEAPDAG